VETNQVAVESGDEISDVESEVEAEEDLEYPAIDVINVDA
jgi:hypothetical protein